MQNTLIFHLELLVDVVSDITCTVSENK